MRAPAGSWLLSLWQHAQRQGWPGHPCRPVRPQISPYSLAQHAMCPSLVQQVQVTCTLHLLLHLLHLLHFAALT